MKLSNTKTHGNIYKKKAKTTHKKLCAYLFVYTILVVIGYAGVVSAQFNPNVCFINGQTINDGQSVTVYEQFEVPFGNTCASVETTFNCNQGILQNFVPSHTPQNYPYDSCRVGDPLPCSLGDQYGQQTVVQHGQTINAYKDDIVEPGFLCSDTGPAGNLGVLECNNGQFDAVSRWIQNINDYAYPSCETRQVKDCEFNGQVVRHGFSVTAYSTPHASTAQQCVSQNRTCQDGNLSGSYQFSSCNQTQAKCGNATDIQHTVAPAYNLCSQGYLLGAVGVNPNSLQWEWSCGGYGLSTVTCNADPTPINTGSAQCGSLPGYNIFLRESMSALCAPGEAINFVQTQRGWEWDCSYNYTTANNCSALNDTKPSASVQYSTTQNTYGPVTATLTNLQPNGAIINNNNGSNTFTFTENGTFNFLVEIDGKVTIVRTEVDWISKRESIFADIIKNYEKFLCLDFQYDLQDSYQSDYTTDIETMKNLCIMRGYDFGSKKLFLPHKKITRKEFLIVMTKMSEAANDYNYIPNNPPKYLYPGATNDLSDFIQWGENMDIIKYFYHTKNNNKISIKWNDPISRKEAYHMWNHTLYYHNLNEKLQERLFDEIDFMYAGYITRGETAHIVRRVLEPYEHLPIGNDYRLLKVIYQNIQNDPIDDQIAALVNINRILTRMPLKMMQSFGLTKRKLITDIQAIIKNTYPERLARETITVDMIRQQLWYESQPEHIIDLNLKKVRDFFDDDYLDKER